MANNPIRPKKPLLRTIHTWIGIVSGVFLAVISLTGSVILFRGEFERAALPRGVAAADASHRASIDQAAREIARLRPDSYVRRVRIPANAVEPYIFQIQAKGERAEKIVSDPSSGQVLGTLQLGWVEKTVDLHRNLMVGSTGRSIVGGFGIVMFVLSTTGMLIWLTGARSWSAWTSVRGRGVRIRFNYELHRASGLWAYAFLALISFTGIELAYPQTFRTAVQSITGQSANVPGPKNIKGAPMLSLDEYVRLGRAAMPDGVPVELRLAEPDKGPVDLRLYRASDLAPSGNHVYLDPVSGSVLMVDRIVDRPMGARFLAAMSPLHYAEFGGLTAKLAWALLGLTPVLLFVTGLLTWWRPKSKSSERSIEQRAHADVSLAGRSA